VKRILKAGITIVTLSPEREFDVSATKSLTKGALEIQLILERAAEESERKSERVGAAWSEKRRRVRDGEAQAPTKRMGNGFKALTHRLPAWVGRQGDRLVEIPDKADVVRLIFRLAASGYGYSAIVKKLTADGVPAFGENVVREGRVRSAHSGKWSIPYVVRILNDRRAVGEYQPCGPGRQPEGAPIKDYFPAGVTEDEFWAARAGNGRRGTKRTTRAGKHVCLFAGLLFNARDGGDYIAASKPTRGAAGAARTYRRVLITRASLVQHVPACSFPLDVFEQAVLSRLAEIRPHDILNGDCPPDETTALRAEHDNVQAELDAGTVFMNEHGFSDAIGKRITLLEERKRKLLADLAQARQQAAHPLSESWGEAKSLVGVLNNATDLVDVRIRLRAALRRIVDSIWILVVTRGRDRLCACQIWFNGAVPRCRSYFILHRAAGNHRPADWYVRSFADVHQADALDLRRKADVRDLERVLQGVDLSELTGS
jgi:hypothetical protein